jgi:hypothetical protein
MGKGKDITIFYRREDKGTEDFISMDYDGYPFLVFLIHSNYFIYMKTNRDLNVIKYMELENKDFKEILGLDILNDDYNILEAKNGFRLYDKEIYSKRGLEFLRQLKVVERKIKLKHLPI